MKIDKEFLRGLCTSGGLIDYPESIICYEIKEDKLFFWFECNDQSTVRYETTYKEYVKQLIKRNIKLI